MDQLIQAFGIDGKLIVVQILNFTLLAAGLSYLLYKPVLKILADREEKIRQGVLDAEAAAKARALADEERKEVLANAQAEAEHINVRARTHAEEIESTIVNEAREKASAIIAKAEATGAELTRDAQAKSDAEIAKLAVLAAENVLRERA
jgi:F-type H+-transporting ATPase subunit b